MARWAPVVGLVLVVALVAATGGLRAAAGVGARTYAIGERVELRRWVFAVESVELVDTTTYGSPSAPTLRVRMAATWTADASIYGLPLGRVTLAVPGGPAPSAETDEVAVGGYSGGYDPDVERPAQLEAAWPDGATQSSPRLAAPAVVQVVLHDERPAQNFLYADQWVATGPVGHVDVPVIDRRTR